MMYVTVISICHAICFQLNHDLCCFVSFMFCFLYPIPFSFSLQVNHISQILAVHRQEGVTIQRPHTESKHQVVSLVLLLYLLCNIMGTTQYYSMNHEIN